MSFLLVFFSFLSFSSAQAEENPTSVLPDIVVQGKRLSTEHRSATVWTSADLEREAGRPVGELLRETAGVDFRLGGSGNNGLNIRGSSSAQALVIIDGVKANDPSTPNRQYDWARLDVSMVERIEILKGPQAVSYGSDAIGGVVLITTKRGRSGISASVEAGSEAFMRTHGSVGVDLNSVHSLNLQAMGKGVFDGNSIAQGTSTRPEYEKESREAAFGAEIDSQWAADLHSKVMGDLRVAHDDVDYGAFQPDPNYVVRNREARGAFLMDGNLGSLKWKGLVSHLDFRRSYLDGADAFHGASDLNYRGDNTRVEFEIHSVREKIEWVVGTEATRETMHIDSIAFPTALLKDSAKSLSLFGEGSLPIESSYGFAFDFGSRVSRFDEFANQASGKIGLSIEPSKKVRADLGLSTGFKAPALSDLYDPYTGNRALKPEESVQAEAGFTARPLSKTEVSLRGFHSRLRNRFSFDSNLSKTVNIARAEVNGIEWEGTQRFGSLVSVRPHVTYLKTKDRSNDRSLLEIPEWKGGMKLEVTPSRESSFTLSYLVKSNRDVSVAYQVTGNQPGFSRFDFTAHYLLSSSFTVTGRAENLLNRKYQEVYGYRTQGLSGYVGLEYRNF